MCTFKRCSLVHLMQCKECLYHSVLSIKRLLKICMLKHVCGVNDDYKTALFYQDKENMMMANETMLHWTDTKVLCTSSCSLLFYITPPLPNSWVSICSICSIVTWEQCVFLFWLCKSWYTIMLFFFLPVKTPAWW